MIHWKNMITSLKEDGISAYAPGAKTGECVSPYVVVKPLNSMRYQNFSSTVDYYDVLCYAKTVSGVLELKTQVKQVLKTLEPSVGTTYTETEPFYDETVHAWMSSMMYQNYKKIIY